MRYFSLTNASFLSEKILKLTEKFLKRSEFLQRGSADFRHSGGLFFSGRVRPAGGAHRAFRCNSQPPCASTAAKLPLCPAPSLRRQLISASIPRAFGRALRSPSDSAVFNAGFCAFYCNICSRGKSPVCCTLANKMFSQSGTNLASKDRKILR